MVAAKSGSWTPAGTVADIKPRDLNARRDGSWLKEAANPTHTVRRETSDLYARRESSLEKEEANRTDMLNPVGDTKQIPVKIRNCSWKDEINCPCPGDKTLPLFGHRVGIHEYGHIQKTPGWDFKMVTPKILFDSLFWGPTLRCQRYISQDRPMPSPCS